MVIVSITINKKFPFNVNSINGFSEHADAYIGEDPQPEVEHVPVELGEAQNDNGQVIEIGKLETGGVVLFPDCLHIEAILKDDLNSNAQNQQSGCQYYERLGCYQWQVVMLQTIIKLDSPHYYLLLYSYL